MEFYLSISQPLKEKFSMIVRRRNCAQAGACVINGAITPDSFRIFGWVQESRCKVCSGPGIEKHRFFECKG